MHISIIVAAAENNVIGLHNKLPWHLPADLKYFKQTTMGKPIIMGRKTFEEVGRVLAGRPNIMITRQPNFRHEGLHVVSSIEAAIEKASTFGADEVFITGGGEIFRQAWPLVNRMYITRVHGNPEGDAFFPAFDAAQWTLVSSRRHEKDEKHAYAFTFEVWERK